MQEATPPSYAGLWRRLGAGIVDLGVLIPLTIPGTIFETSSPAASIAAAVLSQVVYYGYVLPMTMRFGGTLGKLAVGIRVRPLEGGALTWRQVWKRSTVDLLISLVIVAGTIAGHTVVDFAAYRSESWASRSALLEGAVSWYGWASDAYLLWLLSDFIVVLVNRRRRALHDFIAGTVVIVSRGQPAATDLPGQSAPMA